MKHTIILSNSVPKLQAMLYIATVNLVQHDSCSICCPTALFWDSQYVYLKKVILNLKHWAREGWCS